jgi:hypothetical protein
MCIIQTPVDNNNFYYFFSATPQVLGAILALFGVYVIFRIEALRKQLVGFGQTTIDRLERMGNKPNAKKIPLQFSSLVEFKNYRQKLIDAVQRDDYEKLNTLASQIMDQRFKFNVGNISNLIQNLNRLKKITFLWSVLTMFTTVLCLVVIPFGPVLCKSFFNVFPVFILVIVLILIIFILLISVLRLCLNDPPLRSSHSS